MGLTRRLELQLDVDTRSDTPAAIGQLKEEA